MFRTVVTNNLPRNSSGEPTRQHSDSTDSTASTLLDDGNVREAQAPQLSSYGILGTRGARNPYATRQNNNMATANRR